MRSKYGNNFSASGSVKLNTYAQIRIYTMRKLTVRLQYSVYYYADLGVSFGWHSSSAVSLPSSLFSPLLSPWSGGLGILPRKTFDILHCPRWVFTHFLRKKQFSCQETHLMKKFLLLQIDLIKIRPSSVSRRCIAGGFFQHTTIT
jgi:hypothetical protein